MSAAEIVTWLGGVLDQIEQLARDATGEHWRWIDPGGIYPGRKVKQALVADGYPWQMVLPSAIGDVFPSRFDAELITRHDPASVLADIAAKRRILDEHAPLVLTYWPVAMCGICGDREAEPVDHPMGGPGLWWPNAPFPCLTLRLLGSAYAHLPGYQESWRP